MKDVEYEVDAMLRPSLLIVDDDEAVLRGIQLWLGRSYEIFTESDGADVCGRLAVGERFSLILCDLMMRDMTGMRLYEWMSNACPEQAARVIFMTGSSGLDSVEQFRQFVGDRILAKPFDLAELQERLERVLRGGVA